MSDINVFINILKSKYKSYIIYQDYDEDGESFLKFVNYITDIELYLNTLHKPIQLNRDDIQSLIIIDIRNIYLNFKRENILKNLN